MTDLTELRGALEDRADALDGHRADRVAAVHTRVRDVRRRRRATAGTGVVAVLAVVVGVAVLPQRGADGPEPATTVVGLRPPATLDSLGFGYELAEGVDGRDGRAVVRLGASDTPRLVSWATSGADDRVRLRADPLLGDGQRISEAADFTDWILVPAGAGATVSATASSGEPGLAVYTLGEARPDGYTAQGVTFRQSTVGGELLGAAVGDRGRAEVTTPELRAPGGEVSLAYFCSGGPRDAYLHVVSVDAGEVVSGSGCRDVIGVDGSSASASFIQPQGTDLTTRLYVTRGADGPVIDDPDVLAGIGVYDAAEPERGVAAEVEADGHLWRIAEVRRAQPGQRRLATTVPEGAASSESAGGRLVAVFAGGGAGNVRAVLDPGGPAKTGLTVSPGGSSQLVVRAGTDIDMRAPGDGGRFGVAVYARAD